MSSVDNPDKQSNFYHHMLYMGMGPLQTVGGHHNYMYFG